MQATRNRRSNKQAAKQPLQLDMLGSVDAGAAGFDPQLAELLSALNVDAAASPTAALVEAAAAPITEQIEDAPALVADAGEVIELPENDAPDVPLDDIIAQIDAAPAADEPATIPLEDIIAQVETQEHYAMVAPDAPALPQISDEEVAKERLIAEEALADDLKAQVAENTAAPDAATAAAPAAGKTPRAPRVHYENKLDRIKARHGDNLGNYLVLEVADADLDGDALKAKQDETLAIIDAMGVKVKNRASLLIDWVSGKVDKPNEILKRALDVLIADNKITTGENGNLHKNLLAKPYSVSAARSMGRNTVTLMEKLKMLIPSGEKGTFVANPESLLLMAALSKHGVTHAPEAGAAAEPAAPVVEPEVPAAAPEATVDESPAEETAAEETTAE
ncbi:hypothetical protein [Burkholderia vietnamiensis]|uniref:hypothetical protein n=1 Tax=Burkholderia vietnamiensis TaxID=60552 RepID=UPI001CB45E8E|nr:hypothetical protein [Burkholderia vietnamiensis]CAG9228546.1 hypothetical protein BVI1335_70055 [Burkholderia vietnamiensis]